MAETEPIKGVEEPMNGLDVPIKTEPDDPVLEPAAPIAIPPDFRPKNGVLEDSDCEDTTYFTQQELDGTRKCLENTKLIIKDFETQLDWHLQQYMTLRNVFNSKKNSKGGKDDNMRQDLLSISQLSSIIANHPEGNKKFIKRKAAVANGSARKRRRNKESETETETETEEDSEEYDEDFDEDYDSEEDVDDPGVARKSKRGRRKQKEDELEVKDEIEEEEHELIEPKIERDSEEREVVPQPPAKKPRSPRKNQTEAKKTPEKTPAKRGPKPKKAQTKKVDLTNLKSCKVILNRLVEVKDEDIDKNELAELLKSKCITSLEDLTIDAEKPIFILKGDELDTFDFTECKVSNVIVTFEDQESLPEFVFVKNVAKHILDDSIILVQTEVFDQHLSEDKD